MLASIRLRSRLASFEGCLFATKDPMQFRDFLLTSNTAPLGRALQPRQRIMIIHAYEYLDRMLNTDWPAVLKGCL